MVRITQRMSGSHSSGSGQEAQASIESPLPCSTATQSKLTVQPPKLALSRSHTLPDKTQLTLVAMMQRPPPASSAIAHPYEKHKGSPPHPTFLLDKGHLLSFWRCGLPLGRMKEVINILEFVFTQRQTQAAKAALALASRRRPSPRTTPSGRRTRATRCTTPTTQGQGWSSGHTPATPHNSASLPTTPQSSAGHSDTPHITLHHPSTPSITSHQCTPQSSVSQQSSVPCSESLQHRTPQTDPLDLSSPNTNPSHHSSPNSISCQSESKSCQRDVQEQNSSPRQSPAFAKLQSESSQSQQPTLAKSVSEEASPPTTRSTSHAAATEVGTIVIIRQLVP